MGLFDLMKKTNDSPALTDPGDEFHAKITPHNIQVATLFKAKDNTRKTIVRYPNDTTVITTVKKK